MVLYQSTEQDGGLDVAARIRMANWHLVRAAAADLGEGWDLEDTAFELLCECGRAGCRSSVTVGLADYVEARSNGQDVVVGYHEDPLDLVVRRGDGYRVVARAGEQSHNPEVGNWTCSCGQAYRVATRGSHLILWPRNSATGFRRDPIHDRCVNGCAIDRLGVLYDVMAAAPG